MERETTMAYFPWPEENAGGPIPLCQKCSKIEGMVVACHLMGKRNEQPHHFHLNPSLYISKENKD